MLQAHRDLRGLFPAGCAFPGRLRAGASRSPWAGRGEAFPGTAPLERTRTCCSERSPPLSAIPPPLFASAVKPTLMCLRGLTHSGFGSGRCFDVLSLPREGPLARVSPKQSQGRMFRAEGSALHRLREAVACYMLEVVFWIKLLQFRCSVVGR